MIWSGGRILPDDGLSISVLDRTFEHGLGLFETLRTWDGRPTLLDRHKARMLRSAEELKLPIDPASLPGAADVRDLLEAEGSEGDRMLRITASGGTADGKSVVWMRSSPLPPMGEGGAKVLLGAWNVLERDPMARHKALNYWTRRLASEEARAWGFDETLGERSENRDDGEGPHFLEGSRTNLFYIASDRGPLGWFKKRPAYVVTPSTRGPIVPGIMRDEVLKIADGLADQLEIFEWEDVHLAWASEVFLTNSVRGIIPVARAVDAATGVERHRWPAPGPWTRKLQELLDRRLRPDRGTDS